MWSVAVLWLFGIVGSSLVLAQVEKVFGVYSDSSCIAPQYLTYFPPGVCLALSGGLFVR